jgi:aminocarboxymuconate-semialdehyde decarboxylase
MIIDVHAHALSPALIEELARSGTFGIEPMGDAIGYTMQGYGPLDPPIYRFDDRLDGLASRGVDLQLVSPVAAMTAWPGGAADVAWARRLNRSTAEVVGQSGGRFAGLATVCLGEPGKAAEELERALDDHGFVGVQIGTYGGDRPLDDAAFAPLFRVMEERRLFVLMHPTNAEDNRRWRDYTLETVLAWPNETTLAAARLIYAGVFERHPGLRLALAHGGGNILFMRGRIDLAYHASGYEKNPDCRKHISRPPSSYYKQFLFDTAVAAPEMLKFLVETVGAGRVVYGSDAPFEIGDPEGAMAIPAVRALGTGAADAILGGNMRAILAL